MLCYTSKPKYTVEHSKRLGKTPKPAQLSWQNCAMTGQRTDSKVCYALVLDFVVEDGAQSRNRTSDTRIFNAF